MTAAKKPLTDDQKARKNAKAREREAAKKAQREANLAAADAKPTPLTDEVKLECAAIHYDIPSNNPAGYADPSNTLRRIGFRASLSCWILPCGAIPYTFIHELRTKYGATVDVLRFDAAEGPRLARMAVAAMKKEMQENAARARAGIALMEERHLQLEADLAANPEARDEAVKRYEGRCARVLKRMNQIIEDVEVAIRNFGDTPETLGVADARQVYAVLQSGYEAKANAFVAATAALKKLGTSDADALANAAAKDLVPAAVMQDMLRDHGDDVSADTMRKVFDRTAETAPDDGTFSLADVNEDAAA